VNVQIRTFLIWLLVVTLTVPPFTIAHAQSIDPVSPTGNRHQIPPDLSPPIGHVPGDVQPETDKTLYLEQYHYIYSPGPNGTDVVSKRISLAKIDTANPPVVINDFAKEVRIVQDPRTRTLSFQRFIYDSKLKRNRITDAHVFENLDIHSNIAVAGGDAEAYFEESGVVRSFLVRHVTSSFGGKLIVTPAVMPVHPEGLRVSKIEFQSPQLPPNASLNFAVDGELHLTYSDGSRDYARRSETLGNMAVGFTGVLARIQIANPDLDQMAPLQNVLQQNSADLAKFVEANRTLVDSPDNDAVVHALRGLGQKLNYHEIAKLLERDQNGQHEIDRFAQAPRNTYSYDTWARHYQIIIEEQQKDVAAGRTPRSWREILISQAKNVDPEVARLSVEVEQKHKGRIIDRIVTTFNRVATRKRLVITATLTAAVATNYAFNGAPTDWLLGAVSQSLEATTRLPLVNQITGPLSKSFSYFQDASTSQMARLAFGTALIWSLNPLSYVVSKLRGIREGGWPGFTKTWERFKRTDGVQAFFEMGTRGYGLLNSPIQSPAFRAARQQGLYELMVDNNVDPIKHRNSGVFNSPFATQSQIDQKYQRLNGNLNTDASVRGRAALLAAAIVSEANARSGSPIDIATLIMASQGEQLAYFDDLMIDAVKNTRWTETTMSVYRGLTGIGDTGGSVKEEELQRYLEVYQKAANDFRKTSSNSMKLKFAALYRRSKNFMSKDVIPFILFGRQLYDVSRRYRNATVPNETKVIARHGYDEDYRFSTYFYAATDPSKFADIATAGIGAPEIVANQLSQVFIYGVQGAIDPPDVNRGLANPFEPISNQIYAGRGEHQEGVKASLRNLARKAVDPSTPSYAGQHASVMQKLVEGFQVRFAADYVTRIGGVFVIAYMVGSERPIAETLWSTALLSTYFLLAKVSFQVGNGGFIPGYATIWPYIQMAMTHIQGTAGKNASDLRLTDFLITTAIDLKDTDMMKRGVESLQALYRRGGKPIPQGFDIPAGQFTYELAQRFHEARLIDAPVATKISEPIAKWFNRFGALASTALFTSVSAIVYEFAKNPDASAEALLAKTLVWFGATVVTMKGIEYAAPKVLSLFQKEESAKSCVRTLSK
jgi:hypothetical protein